MIKKNPKNILWCAEYALMVENGLSKSSAISQDIIIMPITFAFVLLYDNMRKISFTSEHASQLQKTTDNSLEKSAVKVILINTKAYPQHCCL